MKNLVRKIARRIIGNPMILDSMKLKFFLGQSAIMASSATRSEFRDLWDSEVKVFSQWGEDGIINFILDRIGISKPRILEIGVGDFSECNSRFAVEFRGASAVLVDIHPGLNVGLQNSNLRWKTHIYSLNRKITIDNCNDIYSTAEELIGVLDVISLDIDSNDFWILSNFNNLENVKLIVVEYNALFGANVPLSIPYDSNFDRFDKNSSGQYYGASLSAWVMLLKKRGFELLGTNRVCNNAFFVQENDLKNFNGINIPISNKLDKYVDWRCRDARNSDGNLMYTSGEDRFSLISNEIVENTITGEITSLEIACRGDRI